MNARPPADLTNRVGTALSGRLELFNDAAELPRDPGSYLLFARLDSKLVLSVPRFIGQTLAVGWYLYAGSARGPGGVAARAGRHLRKDKTVRWHIDHLTTAADGLWTASLPGVSECEIAGALAEAPGFNFPVEGFGSSDCHACRAHLLGFKPAD